MLLISNFSLKINAENTNVNTSLLTGRVDTTFAVVPYNPTDTASLDVRHKITRDISHSPLEAQQEDIEVPTMDYVEGEWLQNIWRGLKYLVALFFYAVQSLAEIIQVLKDIFYNIKNAIAQFVGFMVQIIGLLQNGFQTLGNIETKSGNFMDNFFNNIISPFTTELDDENQSNTWFNWFNTMPQDWYDEDYTPFKNSWEIFYKPLSWTLLENTSNFWGGNFSWVLGGETFPFLDLVILSFELLVGMWDWMTLLIIIYLVRFAKLIVTGNWDKIRLELGMIINALRWIINSIIWVFEKIWNVIDLLLNVLIPFT